MKSSVFLGIALIMLGVGSLYAEEHCPATLRLNQLQGQIDLPAGCHIRGGLRIMASNTQLNCHGAIIDGGNTEPIGLFIVGMRKSISNIQVRNCVFRNFTKSGIRIQLRGPKTNKEETYQLAPHDIEIADTIIENSGKVGIYLDDYVSRVTITRSTVRGSGSTAVYLDHATRGNQLINNRFVRNGFKADGSPAREGVAIDGSTDNLIAGNYFEGNSRGGIFLYKNCGEKYSTGQPLRWSHASNNRIINNQFVGGRVGVWIASRQSMNLSTWDCGDKPMDYERQYFEDFANHNTVAGNTFCGVSIAVRIAGDNNIVQHNTYDAETKTMADIPMTKRGELLGRPPAGNVVSDNVQIAHCTIRPSQQEVGLVELGGLIK